MLALKELPRFFTMTIVWAVLVIVALFVISRWLSPYLRLYTASLKLPGPPGHLLIGNILELQGSHLDRLHKYKKLYAQYGGVCRLWLLNRLFILIVDPDDSKFYMANLKTNNRLNSSRAAMRQYCGSGLLTLEDGQVYKSHKKILGTLFYPNLLKTFHLIIEEKARKICKKLSHVADGRTVDIFLYTSEFTMETICATVIGCEAGDLPTKITDLIEAFIEADLMTPYWTTKPWLSVPIVQKLFPLGRKMLQLNKFLDDFGNNVVRRKMKECREDRNGTSVKVSPGFQDSQTVEDDYDEELRRKKRVPSMLDMIVRDSQDNSAALSAEDIKDEMLTIMYAGFVTTGTSLAFLFVLLGIHQEVQEEVVRELEKIFGSSTRSATTEDLNSMEYLERTIKESLRMFPTAPLLGREIGEDIKLPSGHVLPAGAIGFIHMLIVHRDPKSFPNPDSFIPDRWRPENSSQVNLDTYMPFGAGLRTCIGFRYAMMQMKTAASQLLRQFKVNTKYTMKDLTNISPAITLRYNKDYNVQLQKRMARK